MRTTTFTCDNCSRDISDGPHRLVLSEDYFMSRSSVEQILKREQHFCGLKCLDQWSVNHETKSE